MKKVVAVLLTFVFAINIPSAYAEGSVLDALADDNVNPVAADAWQQYIDFLFRYDNVDPEKVAFGYYNAETGEEYYHNADEYFIAASMYKVPLNMIFAEKVGNGEMEMDTKISGVKYSDLQWATIVDSSNERAELMWNYLGGYGVYKRLSAKYLTSDVDNLPYKYYENNWFTPRQYIYCMKLLIENPEQYPGVVDTMIQAGNGVHFKRDVSWCPIASKMGYVTEEYHSVYTDVAIVFTTETFAIVMFTDNLPNPCDVLADYCTLMCDYTNVRAYDKIAKQSVKDRIYSTNILW